MDNQICRHSPCRLRTRFLLLPHLAESSIWISTDFLQPSSNQHSTGKAFFPVSLALLLKLVHWAAPGTRYVEDLGWSEHTKLSPRVNSFVKWLLTRREKSLGFLHRLFFLPREAEITPSTLFLFSLIIMFVAYFEKVGQERFVGMLDLCLEYYTWKSERPKSNILYVTGPKT